MQIFLVLSLLFLPTEEVSNRGLKRIMYIFSRYLEKNAIIGFHIFLYPLHMVSLLHVGTARYSYYFSRHYYLPLYYLVVSD